MCPTGWIGYNDDCYLFTRVNYTFGQGVEYCRQNNATVASLLNEEQNNFAAFTIKSKYNTSTYVIYNIEQYNVMHQYLVNECRLINHPKR